MLLIYVKTIITLIRTGLWVAGVVLRDDLLSGGTRLATPALIFIPRMSID